MLMDSMENSKLFMIALIVCNVILLILVLLFSGSGRGVSDKDLAEIHNRLQIIERRIETAAFDMDRLEGLASKAIILEESMNTGLDREAILVSRIENLEKALVSPVEKPSPKEPEPAVKKAPVVEKPTGDDAEVGTRPAPESTPMGPAAYYTVKKGDTLYSISRQHGLTPDELRQLNRLDSNTIMPGQRLRIQ